MSNPIEVLTEAVGNKINNSRLIAVTPVPGPLPAFTLTFENDHEARAELTISASLVGNVTPGAAELKAQINVNLTEFKQ